MTNWPPPSVDPETQAQVEALLAEAFEYAQQELGENGAFFPYATVLTTDGETQSLMITPEQAQEAPEGQAIVDAIHKWVVEQRGQLLAAAFTADVDTPDGDAIRVKLEHSKGLAILALVHYSGQGTPELTFGDLRAHEADTEIWV